MTVLSDRANGRRVRVGFQLSTMALALALVMPSAWAAPAGQGAAPPAVKRLFKEGTKLVEAGRYLEGLDRLRSAYEQWPSGAILVNIGTTLTQLGRNVEAADAYERFLAEPDRDPGQRTQVETALAAILRKLGTLQVQVNEPGARIVLDGRTIGESAQAVTVRAEPGSHTVAAQKAGFLTAADTVTVYAGGNSTVELRLLARPAPPSEAPVTAPSAPVVTKPAPSPTPERTHRMARWHSDTWGWLVAGGGVAVIAVGGGFLWSAASLDDDAGKEPDAIVRADLLERADSRRTTGYWLLGAGGVTLVAGIIKLAWHDRQSAAARRSTALTVGPGWVGLWRTF